MKKKKIKVVYLEDDQRTIANMNVDGMKGYRGEKTNNKGSNFGETMTRKERRALRRAALLHMLPVLICIILGFSLTFILLYFWLS